MKATNLILTPCPSNLLIRQDPVEIPWKPRVSTGDRVGVWIQSDTINKQTELRLYLDSTEPGLVTITPAQAKSGYRADFTFYSAPSRIVLRCENGEYQVRQLALMRAEEMDAAFKLAPFSEWYRDLLKP